MFLFHTDIQMIFICGAELQLIIDEFFNLYSCKLSIEYQISCSEGKSLIVLTCKSRLKRYLFSNI